MPSQWDDPMGLAMEQAGLASKHGDVPIGAVQFERLVLLVVEVRHDPSLA